MITAKLLVAVAMWLLCDAIYSLYTYLGKEGIKENAIRIVRAIAALWLIYLGFTM